MAKTKRSLAKAPPLLTVRALAKSYGDIHAVRGVDLEVKTGETVVVMGPSGCGKSTMVRCLNRLVEPDHGQILFAGRDLMTLGRDELTRVRRRIGFVFQHSNLIERLNAMDNVAMGLVLNRTPREEAYQLAREALGRVGLASKERRRPRDLSGGERQRVGIARALAMQPELMLWDEPTASLDPILVREVLDVMEELVTAGGTTMLIVTHEVPFALRAADRVVLMEKGLVVEDGPPRDVFAAPQSALGGKYKDLIESYFTAGKALARKRTKKSAAGPEPQTGEAGTLVQSPVAEAKPKRKKEPNSERKPGISA